MRVATKYQKGLVRYFFPCKKCGYIHTEDEYIKYVAPAAYSSSGSGYSGSSSSSSGGSWGGGSSGGGGAGTSF